MQLRWRALTVNPQRVDVNRAERDVMYFVSDFLGKLVDAVAVYPPPPPGSRYVRTGNLYRGWVVNVSRTRTGVEGRVVNYATDRKSGRRYMPFVQGAFQTAVHRTTGWQRIDEARASTQRAYRDGLQRIYSKYIRKGP